MKGVRVLIIDDEAPIRSVLADSLRDDGYHVETASDGESGLKMLEGFRPAVALVDIWMPGRLDGLDVIQEARPRFPNTEFIVMSGHGTIETAVKATKLGAWDFVEKPISMDKISILLTNVLNYQIERGEKNALLTRLRRNIAIVGECPLMVELKSWIASVAQRHEPILILGESGVGRGLTAENVHYLGDMAGGPYVVVKCEALPPELDEIELFGHERGVLAGGNGSKMGKLELAQGGSLYLDEVAALRLSTQESLYEYLKTGRLKRVGGEPDRAFITRVITSTTRNLKEEVANGRFHGPLFELLSEISVTVPALRERLNDLASLVHHFSEHFVKTSGYRSRAFTPAALQHMSEYAWPGNVRELRNFIERIFILIGGTSVDIEDLELAGLKLDRNDDSGFVAFKAPNFKVARAQFEKEYILRKLEENRGNISRTAELIGVERSHLHRKIKAYGIDV